MFVCFMYAIPLDGVSESLVRQHGGFFCYEVMKQGTICTLVVKVAPVQQLQVIWG